jgi:3-ketosteroid 9alpha-monooxygenase subunit A
MAARINLYHGWHQMAFERELRDRITPVSLGQLPLVLIKDRERVRAVDAACPHRGAHLGYGGRIDGEVIVCPFHGHRVGLGAESDCRYKVHEYRTLTVGGLVFLLLDERHENGLSTLLEELNRTHFFVQGFTLTANAPAELVVENGFDPGHFECVHALKSRPSLRLLEGNKGELIVHSTFETAAFDSNWHRDGNGHTSTAIGFVATVFSPNLCISRLGAGEDEHFVISGATPNGDGGCTIRVSVAVRARADGRPPSEQTIRSLLRDSKLAYEQDMVIWEHRVHDAPSRFDEDDGLVIEFHRYCKRFAQADRHAESFTNQAG